MAEFRRPDDEPEPDYPTGRLVWEGFFWALLGWVLVAVAWNRFGSVALTPILTIALFLYAVLMVVLGTRRYGGHILAWSMFVSALVLPFVAGAALLGACVARC